MYDRRVGLEAFRWRSRMVPVRVVIQVGEKLLQFADTQQLRWLMMDHVQHCFDKLLRLDHMQSQDSQLCVFVLLSVSEFFRK